MLQKVLSFLGYFLQQEGGQALDYEQRQYLANYFHLSRRDRANSQFTVIGPSTAKRSFMSLIIETVYDLVKNDQLLPHISF